MNVIIGTGQLGLAILEQLVQDHPSEEVLLINRTGALQQSLPAHVQLLAADATDKHALACIARDATTIYSCTDVPYQQWGAFYPAAAAALAHALDKTTAKLVFADNLYSYGNVAGKTMGESLLHAAATKKGRIRAGVLQTLLDPAHAFHQRVAIVKAADFIGPRIRKGVFGQAFLDSLYNGKPILLSGDPELPHTFTDIRDFARAMVRVGHSPEAFGQVWHVPNAPAISLLSWIRLFEQASGRKARVQIIPKPLLRMAGIFNSLLRELYELAYQFEYPYLVSHEKYAATFGEAFTGPPAIIADTLAWYESARRS